MMKVRMIGVSGSVGEIDMLWRGNWIVREEGMQGRMFFFIVGNIEGV